MPSVKNAKSGGNPLTFGDRCLYNLQRHLTIQAKVGIKPKEA